MPYLNSVTLVGFVGADPEQRQVKKNGAKFTVLSVATQRSWKNAEDEWVSKVEWHRIVFSDHGLPNTFLRRSRRALTYGELAISEFMKRIQLCRGNLRSSAESAFSWGFAAHNSRLQRVEPSQQIGVTFPSRWFAAA